MSESGMSASTFGRDLANKYPGIEPNLKERNTVEFIVPADQIREIVSFIDQSIPSIFPESVFGVDLQEDKYEVIYLFWSYKDRLLIQLRVALEGLEPSIDSCNDIFQGLEWHERETHEMFGITFKGHPDLGLLLLPDELEGKYPLRKNFSTDRSRLSESGLPQPKPRPPPKEGGA
ncbi:MAG: NADH-quinone oxidoreductase subunit C [Candidatus Thorarchaeota archaeon]